MEPKRAWATCQRPQRRGWGGTQYLDPLHGLKGLRFLSDLWLKALCPKTGSKVTTQELGGQVQVEGDTPFSHTHSPAAMCPVN